MAINSGFFDALPIGDGDYDRKYSAAEFAHYFSLLVGNGVFYLPEGGLKVTAEISPSMSVVVNPGNGWINGYYVSVPENAEEHISIPVADAINPRIDSIVMGLSLVNRQVKIYHKKGAASSSPSPVDLIRDASVQEYELAQILIKPGSSSVTNAIITDKRSDSSRCGFVKSLVEKETGYLEDFVKQSQIGDPNGVAPLVNSLVPMKHLDNSEWKDINVVPNEDFLEIRFSIKRTRTRLLVSGSGVVDVSSYKAWFGTIRINIGESFPPLKLHDGFDGPTDITLPLNCCIINPSGSKQYPILVHASLSPTGGGSSGGSITNWRGFQLFIAFDLNSVEVADVKKVPVFFMGEYPFK